MSHYSTGGGAIECFTRETIRACIEILQQIDATVATEVRGNRSLTKSLNVEIAQALLNDKEIDWPLGAVVGSRLWDYLNELVVTTTDLKILRAPHEEPRNMVMNRLPLFKDCTARQDPNGLIVSEAIPLTYHSGSTRRNFDESLGNLRSLEIQLRAMWWKKTVLSKERENMDDAKGQERSEAHVALKTSYVLKEPEKEFNPSSAATHLPPATHSALAVLQTPAAARPPPALVIVPQNPAAAHTPAKQPTWHFNQCLVPHVKWVGKPGENWYNYGEGHDDGDDVVSLQYCCWADLDMLDIET
ncbi:hypothetical protein BU23DRAFT_571270 [Bimuria novae-zelandiae CBS 107.79]|uniref:Uncharacterized protein n=1 Tax=Bimuria novae-zelandiae CBS 107.79 TaxID=1447943 RepID=A0A6A5V8U7_9PLEO|nr:hypothetical protein BU23DRAFT_571270 [Bimuria novae-zelandiae CBS 107.79]